MSDHTYSHPSPGYNSRYSRTDSSHSYYSHTDEEESTTSTPPPRHASKIAPRPPNSPLLNRLSIKKHVDVSYVKSEEQGKLIKMHFVPFGEIEQLKNE